MIVTALRVLGGVVLLATAVNAQKPAAAHDSLPCWDCDRPRQPAHAVLEMQFGMWPQWAVNKFVREGNIGDVNPGFWWRNVRGRWEWDPNSFDINQLGHPGQGSMYYNGWRTNGYGFWGAQAATLGGSFFWECCGERNLPSINDLLTTWLGGANLGEISRRVSDLWIDNGASGGERFVRESGAFLINPVRGLDRVIRGHAWTRGANPAGARPDWLRTSIGTGGVYLDSKRATDGGPASGAKAALRFSYNRPGAARGKPFDHFEIEGELTSIPNAYVYLVRSRGSLFARPLKGIRDTTDLLVSFLRYDYVRSRAFELGQQSVTLAWERKRRWSENLHWTGEFNVRAIPIAAIEDDFLTPFGENRDYDYAFGGGYGTGGTAEWRDRGHLRWHSTHEFYRVVDGEASSHGIVRHELYGQYELTDVLGLGLGLRHQSRRSFLGDGRRSTARAPEVWLSLITVPRGWNF